MSGRSYQGYCPNCRGTVADAYTDHKPFDQVHISCLHCGFTAETVSYYLNLAELNERRKEHNELNELIDEEDRLPILNELPKQDEEFGKRNQND